MESKKLKASSFCSGIGSFEVAMKNLKIPHEINFACEIDKYARQSYLANHECETMYHDMTKEDYVGEHWYSDINVSGIPCQAFSLAGKRLGELDPRGLLFFDFYRYVKNQKPKYFIIENVKGLLSDNEGNTFQNWINLLGKSVNGDQFMFPHEDSLMYNLHWQVLNTKDYGLPQNRERVFLIGIRNDLPNTFVFPKKIPLELRLKDILEDEVDEKYYLSDTAIKGFTNHAERHAEKGNGFKFSPTDGEGIAVTLTTHEGSRGYNNFLKVPSATSSGYEIATEGDSGIINPLKGKTEFGWHFEQSVYDEDGLTRALKAGGGSGNIPKVVSEVKIGAMRGRNPENTSDRTTGAPTQQMLEINENGTSNCLTSVQKDNLVVEVISDIIQLNNPTHSNDRIYSDEGISPTLNTMQGGNRQPFIATEIKVIGSTGGANDHNSRIYSTDGISPTILAGNNGGGQSPVKHLTHDYRIRKLTPKECFFLQGFHEEFFQNAIDAGVSNSQLYKQAGNSISVPVIQAILKNLLKDYIEK